MKKSNAIVNYDSQSDVLFFAIREGNEEEFVEIAPGIHVELDEKGEVIGIEILNASQVLKPVAKLLVPRMEVA